MLLAPSEERRGDHHHGVLVPAGWRSGHDELAADELSPEVVVREGLKIVVRESGRLRFARHLSPPMEPRRYREGTTSNLGGYVERVPCRYRRSRSSAACSAHRRTWSRSPGARNPRASLASSASSASQICPGGCPPCGSGPATPVKPTAMSAPNSLRAPAAISRAHA